ncbi:2-oxoglutarate dehydrogenase E1 component [Bacillus taeanensis]|uniref:2-oxoglutarate dehydrogenase E1 component n=1 Tax=Bacillus taeanensis TaxID=273032 RepID=A0A366Y2P9_9BACI|nr:2-oxoglutarate dehydrogenase E1 component [Bacillus taeanensis]RBW70683.1 2-oxoglutarate dehydrogenase E1 component [Bacillus taeanensis]
MTGKNVKQNPWQRFHGPNLGYMMEQYERYKLDSDSVASELKELFQVWGSPEAEVQAGEETTASQSLLSYSEVMEKAVKAAKLLENIRAYGHLTAAVNPLESNQVENTFLNLGEYELTESDLEAIPSKVMWSDSPDDIQTGLQAAGRLQELYTNSLAYEFNHIPHKEERKWLNQAVESGAFSQPLSKEKKVKLLKRLTEVESFEQFLHRTFVGQKRFSIEGVDALVPMLDATIAEGVQHGARHVMVGMAHRGRLSVLAHVLEKPYSKIFSEFQHKPNKESAAENYGWTGDVKYHLGADKTFEEAGEVQAHITLANNPSHLEFVDPVVLGYTRAAQEDRGKAGYPKQDVTKSFGIIIHGDAAFPGEGIVAETLNLSQLNGYKTGGTLHIIANNQVGFTTNSYDSRSTKYASDLAKGYEIPIVHVNADDPEACLAAVKLAYEYRKRFNKDFLIDLVGYRRFGHNEMDDPAVTQPKIYSQIRNHPTVGKLYGQKLQLEKIITAAEIEKLQHDLEDKLKLEYETASRADQESEEIEVMIPKRIASGIPSTPTGVSFEKLREINSNLLKWPEGFNVYPKLSRILKRREGAFEENGKVDWAQAEALAFASILSEGTPIRLTGQDSERGTFAQRHLVLHDTNTDEIFSPLHALPQAKASFAIHNSPLSEGSVVGFEYGYNVFSPETLVLWEAQYGDFANTAQVIFDQFISAGRAKWGQKSGLVMLLPHGYEGQGPEHSSGRIERYLQLAAENNWTVANVTSAAQYFHILRRQSAVLGKEEVRPLVLMTPKSLLRNTLTSSPHTALSDDRFEVVLEQQGLGKEQDKVERLVLASGKMAIDLAAEIELNKEKADWLHIIRVEQLYPFPKYNIEAILQRYNNLKEVVWVQEEPKNMGAWNYIEAKLRDTAPNHVTVSYIGRPERSSPAGGNPTVHKKEQELILHKALVDRSKLDVHHKEEKSLINN